MAGMVEKEFYSLNSSVNKALSGLEAPLKTKHARSIIILIHKAKEAKSFWMSISRQPLLENRFAAWKFCHLLHKVLREAHECSLQEARSHKKMILEMGKLWGHLEDDIGLCIKSYSTLLVTKISFHEKNRMFPGSLHITLEEIAKFADEDYNLYFQICVEIFDYLDDILNLEVTIFNSINTYRMSSMSKQGQCRLAPLICVIQDSNALYDISVRLMFKLHGKLSSDVLSGHRSRFITIFEKLKSFYNSVQPLQYFMDLIQVPRLPDSIPNFSSQLDFGSYVPPVLKVQTDSDLIVEDTIANSNSGNNMVFKDKNCSCDTLLKSIDEKELEITDLKYNLDCSMTKNENWEKRYNQDVTLLESKNAELYIQLAESRQYCSNILVEKEDLEFQLTNFPTSIEKSSSDEKLKLTEEKFEKLKVLYTQIRDEHINLLRQHGDSMKSLSKERQSSTALLSEKNTLNQELTELKASYSEVLQQIEEKNAFISLLSIQEEDLKNKTQENLVVLATLKEIEVENREMQNKLVELTENITNRDKIIEENNQSIETKSAILTSQNDKINKYEVDLADLKRDVSNYRISLNKNEEQRLGDEQNIHKLKEENGSLEKNIRDLQSVISDHKEKLSLTISEKDSLNNSVKQFQSNFEKAFKFIISTMKNVLASKINDCESQEPMKIMPIVIRDIENVIDEMIFSEFSVTETNIPQIGRIINLSIMFGKLYDQSILIYTSSTDLDKGQAIINKAQFICELYLKLDVNKKENHSNENSIISKIKEELASLKDCIQDMISTLEETMSVDKLVQNELKEMDQAIEDAAIKILKLLSDARSKDDGIKLQVNEKILDACTHLMECIKVLISKSRILQMEIVSNGKGNATANEFYKRNSQWSEGLISASKSIAKAANYLVEAANNAVLQDSGRNFELIVAAQEIAACTAHLVIASKVKANKESKNLTVLTDASRNVTKATGIVVATVRDCSTVIEQSTDLELSKLNPSQLKTVEMEIHVKVLELEQALQLQRKKLTSFRREHYRNSEY